MKRARPRIELPDLDKIKLPKPLKKKLIDVRMVTSTKIEARELRKKYKGKEVVKGYPFR